jgi:uncharacterized protein (DUF427 family)
MIDHPPPTSPFSHTEREAVRVQALFHGHLLASSDDVLVLKTPGRPETRYFPRTDVSSAFLRQTDVIGGGRDAATWYSLQRDGDIVENAAWSFETPDSAFHALAGRIAFREGVVDYAIAPLGHDDIDEVVRHTDSGAGASQAEHWTSNVEPSSDGEPGAPQRPYNGVGSI